MAEMYKCTVVGVSLTTRSVVWRIPIAAGVITMQIHEVTAANGYLHALIFGWLEATWRVKSGEDSHFLRAMQSCNDGRPEMTKMPPASFYK